jgi:hypothetical protein
MTFFKNGFSSTLGVGRSSKLGVGTGKICRALTLNEDISVVLTGTFTRYQKLLASPFTESIIDTSTATTKVTREGFRRLLQRTFLFSATIGTFSSPVRQIKASDFISLSFEDTYAAQAGWSWSLLAGGSIASDAVDLPPIAMPLTGELIVTATPAPALDLIGFAWTTEVVGGSDKHLWCMAIMNTPLDLTFSDVNFGTHSARFEFAGHYRLLGV